MMVCRLLVLTEVGSIWLVSQELEAGVVILFKGISSFIFFLFPFRPSLSFLQVYFHLEGVFDKGAWADWKSFVLHFFGHFFCAGLECI